ncbi:hypothetical protein DU002_00645 [Corallincola holothuriorum]|uniref:Uncharacterized protein n=1 Tax=Corallincola holothuriorum TaxID=2282215 RepID=A0A368NTG7_9GAMM|nr:hypothetical protein [Corallincola holothuriorum]RCU52511.1 hypothetical protein DU002_00645 [Corallincola holothuriorum]
MNHLERQVLDWIAESYPELNLGEQVSHLEVIEREYTGAGVTTSFDASGQLSELRSFNLVGPLVVSPALASDAETMLCIIDGVVDYLDILVRGDGSVEAIDTFKLLDEKVNFIDDPGA